MMNDKELIEISRSVDSYISQLAVKYEISPLSLSAVLIARCMTFNNEAGSTEDFLKLLNSVANNPPLKVTNESQVH
jgi:hypothetical protein